MLLSTEQTRLSLTPRRTFLFSWPQLSFFTPAEAHMKPSTRRKSHIRVLYFSMELHETFPPLYFLTPPSLTNSRVRERERESVCTLPDAPLTSVLHSLTERLPRGLGSARVCLWANIKQMGRGDGWGGGTKNSSPLQIYDVFFFPGRYVQHALTSLISFIYWQRRLLEREQPAGSLPPILTPVTHCLICFSGVDARWAALEGRN